MIRVAVCDDDKADQNKLSLIVTEYFKKVKRTVIVNKFSEGEELLKANVLFDIIFLVVEMKGMNGIETAKKLRTWDVNSKIIYVTNYENYKSQAYKVHAFDYISKPVCRALIYNVLGEAEEYLAGEAEKAKYMFHTEKGTLVLAINEIYYFEYCSRRSIIHSSKGEHTTSYSLTMLYEKFCKFNFESSHKSFIVNMRYINDIKGFDIYLDNGDIVPLAQKRAVVFKRKYNDFLQLTYHEIKF